MARLKKGHKLICIPCGREVKVNAAGVSRTTIWCCGKSMSTGKKKTTKVKKKSAQSSKKRRTR